MSSRNALKFGLVDRAYGQFLRRLAVPVGDAFFGQKLMSRLRFLEEAQWWDRNQILQYQAEKLRHLVQVCYREVPFYRDLFDQHGIDPASIREPADLSKCPIVTKAMLRKAYPDKVVRPTGQRTMESRTSGSTGTNFVVRTDPETFGQARASLLLCLQWAGWRFGEPHFQTGMTLSRDPVRKYKDLLFRCHYVSAYDLRDFHLDYHLKHIETHKLRHLWGYPGSLYALARHARKRGWNQPMRTAVTWGDNLHPHYRHEIEEVFGVQVTDTYGCAEGIQISAQCGTGHTYHIHEVDTLVEAVDKQGELVAPNESGSLILTRLHPGPMPLLRYKVGDRGRLGFLETCACGRQWRTMSEVQGRDTDIIQTPGGNRLIVHFFTGILEHFDGIDSFQATQDRIEEMTLRIVPTEHYHQGDDERIVNALRSRGADLAIRVVLVDEIPLPPSGKRRFVTSSLKAP